LLLAVLLIIDSLNGGGAGGQQDVPAGQLPQHASISRSWKVRHSSCRRFGQHFAGPGIWPGEIISGTYHGRLPPVTPENLAASGG